MDPCFLAWGLGYPVSFPTHTFLFIWNILSAHVTQNTKNNPLFFSKWFHYNHEFYIAYFGRDKIVDFHWNSSDPWTIVSVSDDGESTGGGGTLQVLVFLVILQTVVNWQDKSELCFHLQLELLNLYVSLALYSYWFCSFLTILFVQIWRMSDLIYRPEEEVLQELENFKAHLASCTPRNWNPVIICGIQSSANSE